MITKPTVLTKVVDNNLCIGCGVCVQACPSSALSMTWNTHGFLVASSTDNSCNSDGACIKVCPFNPEPSAHVADESILGSAIFPNAKYNDKKLGRYTGLYAGYSNVFRKTSSSGGAATYIFKEILNRNIADKIVVITESVDGSEYYEYRMISNVDEIQKSSKTKYYPVSLATVFEDINNFDGKVAIAGVGCFIKAIRLAQVNNQHLRDKITFLVGIICGGVKSRFFTEYLASKAGVDSKNISNPDYRIKDQNSTASDYSFGCVDKSDEMLKTIKMKSVGDMWGTGLFKANACDYCDDVTTELADVSLGDAWIEPFSNDGLGTNVIITRSQVADVIVREGASKGELELEELDSNKMISSQRGSFTHRHDGIGIRIIEAKMFGKTIPKKRISNLLFGLDVLFVQIFRRMARRKSLELWALEANATSFDAGMRRTLYMLRFFTRVNHFKKRVYEKLKGASQ